jgi:hypothetical protein
MEVNSEMNAIAAMSAQVGKPSKARVENSASFAATLADKLARTNSAPAPASVGQTDFTNMTASQMEGAAKKLYESGDIDLTQLGMLEMAGPLGKVGANGEFVPFTAEERQRIRNLPVDYIRLAKDAIAGIESRGQAADPTSGYKDWKQILGVLRTHQGVASGIDIRA